MRRRFSPRPPRSWPDAGGSDDLAQWRCRRLLAAGFDQDLAQPLAADCGFDLHALIELAEAGCPPHLAARILAPLDDEAGPC